MITQFLDGANSDNVIFILGNGASRDDAVSVLLQPGGVCASSYNATLPNDAAANRDNDGPAFFFLFPPLM